MHKYIVSTHLGDYETTAPSPEKAISNIRWRIFGRRADGSKTKYWTVTEAA